MHIFFAMQIYIFFRSSDTFLSNRPKAIINAQTSCPLLFFQPLAYPIPSLPVPPPSTVPSLYPLRTLNEPSPHAQSTPFLPTPQTLFPSIPPSLPLHLLISS